MAWFVSVLVCFAAYVLALSVGQSTGQGCNGSPATLQAEDAIQTFESPNYPLFYPNYADCGWYIVGPPNTRVTIYIENFDLEYHYSCSYDTLEIFDGDSISSSQMARLCGQSLSSGQRRHTASSNEIFVNFHSDWSIFRTGFQINYQILQDQGSGTPQEQCTGDSLFPLNASSVVRTLESPNYPATYPNNVKCGWKIIAPTNTRVSLYINDFHLEAQSSCSYDVLEIFNGGSVDIEPMARLCGTDLLTGQRTYISTSNEITLRFTSDVSVTRIGFQISYHITDTEPEEPEQDACSGTTAVLNANSSIQSFKSPNYPSNYNNGAGCEWKIIAPVDYVVTIHITDFDVEYHYNCDWDKLYIFDGDNSNPLATLCGLTLLPSQRTYTSTYNELTVRFESDPSITRRGFVIDYQKLPAVQTSQATTPGSTYTPTTPYPNTTSWTTYPSSSTLNNTSAVPSCPSDIVELQAGHVPGVITSANYPANYPNNEYCRWRVESPTGHVKITIVDYAIESHPTCIFDSLNVSYNLSPNSPPFDKLCGISTYIRVFYSPFNVTYISFRSDHIVAMRGFNLTYESVEEIGNVSATTPGSTYTPTTPYPNTTSWTTYPSLKTSSDTSSGPTCPSGIVELQAGAVPASLYSPNYPENYPNNEYCRWRIVSPSGYVKISVVDYYIEIHPECLFDSLNISYNSTPNAPPFAKVCGWTTTFNSVFYSPSNVVYIGFHSDASVSRGGFNLTYEFVQERGNDTGIAQVYNYTTSIPFTSSSTSPNTSIEPRCPPDIVQLQADDVPKVITSMNYPANYRSYSDCRWRIESPSGYVKITIVDYDIEPDPSCVYDSLNIHYEMSVKSQPIARLCGISTSNVVLYSPSNVVFIYFFSDSFINSRGFNLTYQSVQERGNDTGFNYATDIPYPSSNTSNNTSDGSICLPGYLAMHAGSDPVVIESTNYPANYPSNENRGWCIESSLGVGRIIVEDYDIEYHFSCAYDRLDIYDDPPSLSSRVVRLCGTSNTTEEYDINSNLIYILFHSDGSQTKRGFRLTYQMDFSDYLPL